MKGSELFSSQLVSNPDPGCKYNKEFRSTLLNPTCGKLVCFWGTNCKSPWWGYKELIRSVDRSKPWWRTTTLCHLNERACPPVGMEPRQTSPWPPRTCRAVQLAGGRLPRHKTTGSSINNLRRSYAYTNRIVPGGQTENPPEEVDSQASVKSCERSFRFDL